MEVDEDKPYPSLQRRFAETYAGRTISFLELLNEDYPDGIWLEPEYRWALDGMEKHSPASVSITRNRMTQAGKPASRGIQHPDILTFPATES